jgi:hypothetical protein
MTLRWAAAIGLVGAVVLGGCAAGAPSKPPAAIGQDVVGARVALESAFAPGSLQLRDPQVPFRPAEGPAFAAAPRAVVQVVLPDDPAHGYISVYQFPDDRSATAAASEQAAYLASGPGRVQFPPDTRFVLRQLGTTILFYAWSPSNSPDPRTPQIQEALETIGVEIPVPL